MSVVLWNLGRTDEAAELVEQAFAVLAADEPDADIAMLAAEAARIHLFRGQKETALERVNFALDIAEAQNLPEVLSEALNTKAMLVADHPHEWRALLREALAIALEHDLLLSALRAYNNLAIALWTTGRDDEADALTSEALELARSRGNVSYTGWFAAAHVILLIQDGAWDEALAVADDLLPVGPAAQGNPALACCLLADLALDRGDRESAAGYLDRIAPGLESSSDQQQQALLYYRDRVRALAEHRIDDLLDLVEISADLALELGYDESAAGLVGRGVDAARDAADRDRLSRLVDLVDQRSTVRRTRGFDAELDRARGTLASLAEDHDGAIDALARALGHARGRGKAFLLARVLAEYGAALARAGRHEEAEPLLVEARSLFEQMGASVWLQRIDAVAPAVRS